MTNKITNAQVAESILAAANHSALKQLAEVAGVLERAHREVNNYMARYVDAKTPLEKAQVMNWAIGYVTSSIMNNMRVDLMANAQANLIQAEAAIRAAEILDKQS